MLRINNIGKFSSADKTNYFWILYYDFFQLVRIRPSFVKKNMNVIQLYGSTSFCFRNEVEDIELP